MTMPNAHLVTKRTKIDYGVGAAHTSTNMGFWLIFKRGAVGTYHKTTKYSSLYVAKFQFRYNNPNNPDIFGAAIRGC